MENVLFRSQIDGVKPDALLGFFVDWPDPPSPETHLKILRNSWAVELACDPDTGRVVGFVNAISDGVYSAYLPLLEVLPSYQGRGIGRELVRRMMDRCAGFYMVDVCCDEEIAPFYAKFGMTPVRGMCARDFNHQSGMAS